jgi:threonine dehydrogenase-like Zn-dependent dehydrogenase
MTQVTHLARLVAPRRTEIVAHDVGVPGEGQVLVRIQACGVCASELHAWKEPQAIYPIAMGHEPVGVVDDTGPGVDRVAVGDLVTGRCGRRSRTSSSRISAISWWCPPGWSSTMPLGEPLGCAVEARRRTAVTPGDAVAVVGTGYMGLLMIELLAIDGVERIVAVDPREEARATALAQGAGEGRAPRAPMTTSPGRSTWWWRPPARRTGSTRPRCWCASTA